MKSRMMKAKIKAGDVEIEGGGGIRGWQKKIEGGEGKIEGGEGIREW